jgi:hypothetical protein
MRRTVGKDPPRLVFCIRASGKKAEKGLLRVAGLLLHVVGWFVERYRQVRSDETGL